MNTLLFDSAESRSSLYPLTFTRPVGALRIGILTIAEKWERYLDTKISFLTDTYLKKKFPPVIAEENLIINSCIIPDKELILKINMLAKGEILVQGKITIAACAASGDLKNSRFNTEVNSGRRIEYKRSFDIIKYPYDMYMLNPGQIGKDIALINSRGHFRTDDEHTIIYNKDQVFSDGQVTVRAGILDATEGPIFLGRNASIQPGAILIGPCAVLENSIISAGAKIRTGSTIGPGCKIGGELHYVIFQGNSNKAHDGFLGSSVIGEWCNFGAATNNSNLKNNYSTVRLWNYSTEDFKETGLLHCGLVMGDHSKSGINTMFTTGTVAGVCSNIFGEGFMPKFIPSFSWGGSKSIATYELGKALETINKVMARRNAQLSIEDRDILQHIFNFTARYRTKI